VKIAIHGATGRMGQSIVRAARLLGDVEIVGGACSPGDAGLGRDLGEIAGVGALGVVAGADVGAALLGADVVIDFSTASAVAPLATLAARQGVALVSGTTGLDAAAQSALERAAAAVPVLWAPNTSLGVQVLAELVEQAVRRLGSSFDVEIVEVHHRRKIDAPSGTARRLADAARGGRATLKNLHGRDGNVGPRTAEELGVVAVRGGDAIGDHTVFLLGNGERLELTHRASSRDLFADGALRAARFLIGKPAARYSLADVLGSAAPTA
jgi:4-hydroxy-tetrahydrodipicolinate reductase